MPFPFCRRCSPTPNSPWGADPRRLVVWARPADQLLVKKAVDEMSKQEPPETAPRVVVYTLENNTARNALPILQAMFPSAQFTAGADSNKVVAFARPADHEAIKGAVAQLSEKEPPETARRIAVFTVEVTGMTSTGARSSLGSTSTASSTVATGGAASMMPVLRPMFPDALFSVGTDPNRLVVYARPADLEQIKKAIDEMGKKEPAETAPRVVVYTLAQSTATAALPLLQAMFPGVQFAPGTELNKVAALARPAQHALIKTAVDQMSAPEPSETARRVVVYRCRTADPASALKALTALVPAAQISVDTATRSLVASALPNDHAKIRAAIDDLDRDDPNSGSPRLQVHRLVSSNGTSLLAVLTNLFRSRLDVAVSYDDKKQRDRGVGPARAAGLDPDPGSAGGQGSAVRP